MQGGRAQRRGYRNFSPQITQMDTDFYFYEVEQNCPSARVTPLRPSDTSPDMGGV